MRGLLRTGESAALVVTMLVGAVVTIGALMPLLGRVNEGYAHVREARGLDSFGQAPLEGVMVVSALVALVIFLVWFFVIGDTGAPLPIPEGGG